MRLCTRVRLKPGRRSERKRSSLWPSWLSSTSGVSRSSAQNLFDRGMRSVTMVVAREPDNTPLPGTVFSPRQVQALKIAVIVMGLLLVGGFVFVLAAIVYQASGGGQTGARTSVPPSGVESAPPIPQDATVTSPALRADRPASHLNSATA